MSAYIYETPVRPTNIRIPDAPRRHVIPRSPAIGENLNSAFRKINFDNINDNINININMNFFTPIKNNNGELPKIPETPAKKNNTNGEYFYTPKKLNFDEKVSIPPPPPVKRKRDYPLDELVEGMPSPKKSNITK